MTVFFYLAGLASGVLIGMLAVLAGRP